MWLVLTLALTLPTSSMESLATSTPGSVPAVKVKEHSCACDWSCAGRCCCLRKSTAKAQTTTTPASLTLAPVVERTVCLTSAPCRPQHAPPSSTFSTASDLNSPQCPRMGASSHHSQSLWVAAACCKSLSRARPLAEPPEFSRAG